MAYLFLLQEIFPTQESNPHLLQLLHWQADSLPLCHLGSPKMEYCSAMKKNDILPFVATWMDLVGIMLSETIQTKPNANFTNM